MSIINIKMFTQRTVFVEILIIFVGLNNVDNLLASQSDFRETVNISHPACGIHIQERIVSGSFAKEHHYPFYSVLLHEGRPFGGATILNEHWLLTASHIVTSSVWKNSSSSIKIGLGSNRLEEMELYDIEQSIPHPNFKIDKRFDIALIRLEKPLRFSSSIYPVCFPNKVFEKVPTKKVNVIGFGYENYKSGYGTTTIKTVILDVIPMMECVDKYSKISNPIWPVNTCTWTEGKDACLGDSGGPMFVKHNGRFVQWGVVSYGVTCADEYPGVFATITYFLHWIHRVIQQ